MYKISGILGKIKPKIILYGLFCAVIFVLSVYIHKQLTTNSNGKETKATSTKSSSSQTITQRHESKDEAYGDSRNIHAGKVAVSPNEDDEPVENRQGQLQPADSDEFEELPPLEEFPALKRLEEQNSLPYDPTPSEFDPRLDDPTDFSIDDSD